MALQIWEIWALGVLAVEFLLFLLPSHPRCLLQAWLCIILLRFIALSHPPTAHQLLPNTTQSQTFADLQAAYREMVRGHHTLYLFTNTNINTSIDKQLQYRERNANENILSVLNTQQTTSKIYQFVTKKDGMSIHSDCNVSYSSC